MYRGRSRWWQMARKFFFETNRSAELEIIIRIRTLNTESAESGGVATCRSYGAFNGHSSSSPSNPCAERRARTFRYFPSCKRRHVAELLYSPLSSIPFEMSQSRIRVETAADLTSPASARADVVRVLSTALAAADSSTSSPSTHDLAIPT